MRGLQDDLLSLTINLINFISFNKFYSKHQPEDLIAALTNLKSFEESKFIIKKTTKNKYQRLVCYLLVGVNFISISRWLILGITNNQYLQFILGDYFAKSDERVFLNCLCFIAAKLVLAINIYNIILNNYIDSPFIEVLENYVSGIRNSKKVFFLSPQFEKLFRTWFIFGVTKIPFFAHSFIHLFTISHFATAYTVTSDLESLLIQFAFVFVVFYFLHFSIIHGFWLFIHFIITVSFTYYQLSSFSTRSYIESNCFKNQYHFLNELQKFNNWLDSFNKQIRLPTLVLFSYITCLITLVIFYASQHHFSIIWMNYLFRVVSVFFFVTNSYFNYLFSFVSKCVSTISI
ncbi:uncharacterized protein LOC128386266 [Panonychus citri]|uniref:uncharacterized protein LOC128386266 n=1 Tax=Panonychus citri TaxID=50023 RepID=UPI002307D4AF|nr:uncharacterized protein LOC128386266 [Panonychus citri]